MLITKFWVVTRPTKDSVLEDIMFDSTMAKMALQFKGGLDPDDIIGVYTTMNQAHEVAACMLEAQAKINALALEKGGSQ